ncbi:MAG: hypothetical protein WCK51_01505 [Armatimonadota bacterium]
MTHSKEDPAVQIAVELMKLGVSHAGVVELLSFPHERIKRQLSFMPFRKAKRPEAFIVDAIRHDYSPPKEYYYAKNKAAFATNQLSMDKDPQRTDRPALTETQGHRTENAPHPAETDDRMEQGGPLGDTILPIPE